MLRKNSRLAFGGMWVFPGGRIDDGDRVADADELTAAANAAVREAAEEAGLVVPSSALIPFSHWTPPLAAPKRFLTWFFLAPAPTAVVVIDRGEIHDHAWMRPGVALVRRDEGRSARSRDTVGDSGVPVPSFEGDRGSCGEKSGRNGDTSRTEKHTSPPFRVVRLARDSTATQLAARENFRR